MGYYEPRGYYIDDADEFICVNTEFSQHWFDGILAYDPQLSAEHGAHPFSAALVQVR